MSGPFHTTKAKLNALPVQRLAKTLFSIVEGVATLSRCVEASHVMFKLNFAPLPQYHYQYNKENLAVAST